MKKFLQKLKKNMQIKYSNQSIVDLNNIIEYISKDILDVKDKVYTRDIFNSDD